MNTLFFFVSYLPNAQSFLDLDTEVQDQQKLQKPTLTFVESENLNPWAHTRAQAQSITN